MAVLSTRSGQMIRSPRFGLQMADFILSRIRSLSAARPSHFYQGPANGIFNKAGQPQWPFYHSRWPFYQGRPAQGPGQWPQWPFAQGPGQWPQWPFKAWQGEWPLYQGRPAAVAILSKPMAVLSRPASPMAVLSEPGAVLSRLRTPDGHFIKANGRFIKAL